MHVWRICQEVQSFGLHVVWGNASSVLFEVHVSSRHLILTVFHRLKLQSVRYDHIFVCMAHVLQALSIEQITGIWLKIL